MSLLIYHYIINPKSKQTKKTRQRLHVYSDMDGAPILIFPTRVLTYGPDKNKLRGHNKLFLKTSNKSTSARNPSAFFLRDFAESFYFLLLGFFSISRKKWKDNGYFLHLYCVKMSVCFHTNIAFISKGSKKGSEWKLDLCPGLLYFNSYRLQPLLITIDLFRKWQQWKQLILIVTE